MGPYGTCSFDRSRSGQLGLGDLVALDAARANANALGDATNEGLDRLEVHIPAAASDVVSVRNIVTVLRTLPANLAYLCHDLAPNLS